MRVHRMHLGYMLNCRTQIRVTRGGKFPKVKQTATEPLVTFRLKSKRGKVLFEHQVNTKTGEIKRLR